MKRFTQQEDDFLRQNYLSLTLMELADSLNRAFGSVHGRMQRIGLVVPGDIKRQRQRMGLQKGWNLMHQTYFKKGHVPWNKGIKGLQIGGAETQFKKGHQPHNTKIDGAISIRYDNTGRAYKYIRLQKSNWELLHRNVWRNQNGEIPKGMIIKFKDGNTMNCTINNLYLTNRAVNMADNTIHRYPDNVKTAIRTVNKLVRTIKKQ